jgi:hypothetical protein
MSLSWSYYIVVNRGNEFDFVFLYWDNSAAKLSSEPRTIAKQ